MALMPQRTWVRVPSTQPTSGPMDPHTEVGSLVPEAPEGQPMASCSHVGGRGCFPATPKSVSMVEMVEAPVRMPVHIGATTPSCGGREGRDGTGVSRRPEATRGIASFLY
jgi:hypothetical protein